MITQGFKRVYKVEELRTVPNPFFCIVVFESESEYHEDYDNPSRNYYANVKRSHLYVTTDKEVLGKGVLELNKDKKDFVFFQIDKLGTFEIETKLNLI